jgi:hypothetical protein
LALCAANNSYFTKLNYIHDFPKTQKEFARQFTRAELNKYREEFIFQGRPAKKSNYFTGNSFGAYSQRTMMMWW